jgi:hypothetical protein
MPSPRIFSDPQRRREWFIAATVLFGAWLLFQIQPMAGKRILPWFGGGPAVWTTAMLFFQALLLGGYLYAHLSTRLLPPRAQPLLHAALLLFAVVMLAMYGVSLGNEWKPADSGHPQLRILAILAVSVGLPYLMLSATAPLVQSWLGRTSAGKSPYRLYALSNFGSLAALVSYPVIVEPLMGLHMQGILWSGLFLAFAVLCALSGWSASGAVPDEQMREAPPRAKPLPPEMRRKTTRSGKNSATTKDGIPTMLDRFFWVALPACASSMLLAVTNYLCQDVAPVPLLWIAPLVVYLVTFILTFASDRWYRRWPWLVAMGVLSYAACNCWTQNGDEVFGWQAAVHLGLLFTVGMVCHGEVARRRPAANYLTSFYLLLAAGGAIGGLLVAVVAPRVFNGYYELPLGMLVAFLLAMGVLISDRESALYLGGSPALWVGIVLVGGVLAYLAQSPYATARPLAIAMERNFFGVLTVQEAEWGNSGIICRRLLNGRISHGAQMLDKDRRGEPTQYYARTSGVGKLLDSMPTDAPRRVGVVGLGAGTLAAYAKQGDEFKFYEINPDVISFADQYFTFLADARERGAKLEIVSGDARLALEREQPQQFHVLVLDAFSGDAIPVHLLTSEAIELYLRHLRQPDGVLAIHVTNRNLDLGPVVKAIADRYNFDARVVLNQRDEPAAIQAAIWILLYPREKTGKMDRIGRPLELGRVRSRPILWTDDYSSLIDVVIWE